jgi:FkbM family methyltransferase
MALIPAALRSIAKRVIREDSWIFAWLYLHLYRRPARGSIIGALKSYAETHDGMRFVQVGSNDGSSGDPIYKLVRLYGWSGILVEPLPFLFEQLKRNYSRARSSSLVFENIAIAGDAPEKKIYYFNVAGAGREVPAWLNLLASFRPEHLEKVQKVYPHLEILSTTVPCMTLDQLLSKHSIDRLDLLHIDTEGWDFEVLKTLSLDRVKPAMILYEHIHLSSADQAECQAYLRARGYVLTVESADTLAIAAP